MKNGRIVCTAHNRDSEACLSLFNGQDMMRISLHGGSISPGFTTFGSILGIGEMQAETSTGDGSPGFDPLVGEAPEIMGDELGIVQVVGALKFGTRDAL